MKKFLHHFFIPKESNNHRPKLLHHSSLLCLAILLFLGQFLLVGNRSHSTDILGITIDITSQRLLDVTNQKRKEDKAQPLVFNEDLSKAAYEKAKDMFAKNYWAHTAPDGTTPWVFIKKVGYDYTFAGENLARGFTSSDDVIKAWMASPSHKENMLSKNYSDVGFAFMEGKLMGEDTVLVVEMFGNKNLPQYASAQEGGSTPVKRTTQGFAINTGILNKPLINTQAASTNIIVILLSVFIFVLMIDMILIGRRKIVRVVGHNLDHIFFFTFIIILVILYKGGIIL